MMDLSPGSEAARLTRAACTLVTNLYPSGYAHFDLHDEMLRDARCIETTRALVETLTRVGIPARLLPVDIIVNNPEAYRQKQRNIPIQHWPPEAWSVGVINGDEAPPRPANARRGWDGHMLVRVAREWLCDPNAGQFHRPDKIHMPPGWTIEYPKDWDRDAWAIVGIVSSLAPSPETPQFPILQIRQRRDNLGWKRGTAATVDVSPIADAATEILTRLREGTLDPAFELHQGDEVAIVDVSSVIDRYERDANV